MDARGRFDRACVGVMMADRTCIFAPGLWGTPGFRATAADGARLWSVTDDRYEWVGAERWSRPLVTQPDQVLVNAARDRIYVGSPPGQIPLVRALALSSGATVWRTRTGDAARLMSVGRGGRVYLAIDAQRHLAARAVRFTNGATAWEHRTSQPVQGMRELVNGAVAIAAAPGRYSPSSSGRMTIVDPR